MNPNVCPIPQLFPFMETLQLIESIATKEATHLVSESQSQSQSQSRSLMPWQIPNIGPGMDYLTPDGFLICMFSHAYSVEYPNCRGGIGRISANDGNLRTVKFGEQSDGQTQERARAYLNLLGEQVTRNDAWGFGCMLISRGNSDGY
jgi:hypothetical protein